jgi:hypothetical protein
VHHALQRQPLATSGALVKATALTAATVNKSLAHLERLGIVSELTNRQRGRVFACRRYVDELAAELGGTRQARRQTQRRPGFPCLQPPQAGDAGRACPGAINLR